MGKDPREYCIMSKEFVDDGEGKVKGANISWGARLARTELHRLGIRD